ncbi:hypothetical protein AQUCO_00400054v1 [Aquilegia coerulea]|uniref:TRAF-type domain-containing protein n=1 Tax=Aquilegia coerulea TaxID=218851 RepID=A0A2G5ETF5_AQUCA|nr:hypothetical protein AQUCO_00400054v1 [Aquilegia coerulea]
MDFTDINLMEDEKKFEKVKEGPSFHCDLCDSEVVREIADVLVMGLSTACVDNTTADLFKGPAFVAVDMRKEMIEYLTQRSETYVAEVVVQEGGADAETSDHPTEIISDFIDDFASSKRNMFSRVSGWLLSETREDKIDDFVQEMDLSTFWLMERREAIAKTLLRNVDFKDKFHCKMKFHTTEELTEHRNQCSFRYIRCINEGCNVSYSELHKEKHDLTCPFKILPCEQNCSTSLMRREMDRHCITVCPMKLVSCPFYQVGCESTIPQSMVVQHCSEFLRSHLVQILHVIHKVASAEQLTSRVEQIEKSSSVSELAAVRDMRSLTLLVKELDTKLGSLE